jgi:hypothetical protein
MKAVLWASHGTAVTVTVVLILILQYIRYMGVRCYYYYYYQVLYYCTILRNIITLPGRFLKGKYVLALA